MIIFTELLQGLRGMFLADRSLALATLGLVAFVSVLVLALKVQPLACGGVLVLGCLAVLVRTVSIEAGEIRRQ